MYNTLNKFSRIILTAGLAVAAAGCSRTQTAQASKRDGDPKPVSVAVVHQASVPRAVDVVGTLAAVDQVTVSSEADGKVQKINADLGDRVRAGQVLIQLDDEKQRYAYEQQQAALARALAQYGAPDPEHLPAIEETPDAKRTKADLAQATRPTSVPTSCSSAPLSPSRRWRMQRRRSRRRRPPMMPRCTMRETCGRASRRPRPP